MFPTPARLLALTVLVLLLVMPTTAQARGSRFSGKNLAGWQLSVGDGLFAPPGEKPVGRSDLRLKHLRGWSELTVNVKRRPVMAHGMSTKKIRLANPFTYVSSADYWIRVPHPGQQALQQYNGETVEGHISLYDGRQKLEYVLGWQWILNPWSQTGDFRVFATGGQWVSLANFAPDTEWHHIQLRLDPVSNTASIAFDATTFNVAFAQRNMPDWGTDQSAWVAVEAISIYPGSNNYGATHVVEVRDWKWTLN